MSYEAGQMARFVACESDGSTYAFEAYAAHNNQPVVILRHIGNRNGGAYEILAVDGWEGVAYEDELQPLQE